MKKLRGRTDGQTAYIRMINSHEVTICHGPAGSGKTHIAAALAAFALTKKSGPISGIVLCRPVVDCGQSIGYLPGTIEDKIGPYLAPLFDELSYYFDREDVHAMLEKKIIEIVPLSMMRGRTFNNAFVICDEAQNATEDELKMLLTRIGQDSKMVLSGDSEQSDMPGHAFNRVTRLMAEVEEIGIIQLTKKDIVRNSLITKIITAFETPPVASNDYDDYEEED